MLVLDDINEPIVEQFMLNVSFFLYISDGSKKTVDDGFSKESLRVRNAKNTCFIDFNIIKKIKKFKQHLLQPGG